MNVNIKFKVLYFFPFLNQEPWYAYVSILYAIFYRLIVYTNRIIIKSIKMCVSVFFSLQLFNFLRLVFRLKSSNVVVDNILFLFWHEFVSQQYIPKLKRNRRRKKNSNNILWSWIRIFCHVFQSAILQINIDTSMHTRYIQYTCTWESVAKTVKYGVKLTKEKILRGLRLESVFFLFLTFFFAHLSDTLFFYRCTRLRIHITWKLTYCFHSFLFTPL